MEAKHNKPLLNYYLEFASIGVRMVIIMSAAIWIGLRLDKYFEVKFPIFLSVFSLGSTALSIYMTIRKLISNLNKHKSQAKPDKNSN